VSAVADQFQPLHEMVTSPDGGKSPSLAAKYILALGNVQVRLESLFGAGIQWDPVKAFIDSIANNISTNEFQEAYRQIGIITRQSTTRSTQPIGEMLEQPLRQAWSAMLIEAGLQLDRLWKAQISDGFKRELENGFPFNPAGRDVAIASVAEFLRPREGTLDAFYDKELKMFLTTSGDAVVPRTLMNAQVAFSQSFLDFVGKMNAVRQALFPLGSPDAAVNFDLTADATPGVTQSLLEIDGNRLLYRNEAPSPVSFSWPSKSGTSQARLTISLEGSGEHPSARAEGEWALFRLLGQARIDRQSQNSYLVVWSLRGADGTGRDVRYRLQARTIRNPFAPDFFRGIVCPERATQPAAYPGSDGSVR
jgi:type VI secretion system protein ImpL